MAEGGEAEGAPAPRWQVPGQESGRSQGACPSVAPDPDSLPIPLRLLRAPPSTEEAGPQKTTTLVIRNVPRGYSQEQLLTEFSLGDTFDIFFLVPAHLSENKLVKEEVLIHFRTEEAAAVFEDKWQAQKMKRQPKKSWPLEVYPASVQGFWKTLALVSDLVED